jgi:hypothetical protein
MKIRDPFSGLAIFERKPEAAPITEKWLEGDLCFYLGDVGFYSYQPAF